ncbi:hypothetical protein V1520DRAFT_137619 [Lipomyces starkeyi]|uniref:Uncharacterized protein n=1 Tax=Lipomyces starkeyi NRRL Y-11557 TaxID=675824 RepID=A0A1E3PYT3_LIPST|nr:hypothetical protein LIPSTDRAFT_168614 [Lipomyces starkeyi NRRL Y-11557]
MAHKHSSSSASMASDRDVDEGDFLVPAESIESTNEVQTATAASLIGTRPTQVLVNPRRVSGTPSISSTVSGSTVTPATVGTRAKDVMPPPPIAPRTVYAAPVAEYNNDLEIGPPSPTASTTSFFTSTSGAEQSANEMDTYVDAVDDGYSSRASTETIPAAFVSSAAVSSATAAPDVALETFESTPAMTDVSTNHTAVPESNGSAMSEKAGLVGTAVEVDSAPIAAAAIGKITTKSGVTNGAANTGKVPVAIEEKALTSKKKSNKWKWVIILAVIVAIAIGVGVGVGVGVGTRKRQNSNNSTAAGGASSSDVSSTTATSSLIGARSSAISGTSISVASGSASVTSAANSKATSATASTSPASSASSTRALSSFSTVTTTQSSASSSRSSPSATSRVSSDASSRTAPSSANPSLSVFRSIYTTTFPTTVVATRTYLDFPFRTTVVVTTTAVRTAIHTLTVS